MQDIPLIVIAGPTASGKTGLAVRLAKQFGGEIISADSRAVYRGLDVGTAKPSVEEREGVVHWGIDIVEPGERFTAADFQQYALHAIQDIRSRGRVPFLVGGTGLYIDSVIYNYGFSASGADLARRKALQDLSIEELHAYCRENNVELPSNKLNARHVVNNILRHGQEYKRNLFPAKNTVIVAITTEKHELWSRIAARAPLMWRAGLVEEARMAAANSGWECEALTSTTYRIAHEYLDGLLSEDEAIERIVILDRQLAKRQLTWLRRNEHIMWLTLDRAYTYLAQVLADRSDS